MYFLGDPRKVDYITHKSSVQGETTIEGKGKAIVLVKNNKAAVMCNGAGEPSNRHNTTLLIPELHHQLRLPWHLLNTEEEAGFVHWHSQLQGQDG